MTEETLQQAFEEGLQLHQSGRLSDAEKAYRRVLQADPEHSDAVHFLGIVAMQTGNLLPALDLVEQSIDLRPDGAIYRNNLGQILERLDRSDEAAAAYRKAIELDAGYAEAHNNLGRLLQGEDDLANAESCFREAIRLDKGYADPHTNLGNLFKDRGDLDEAIIAYRRAIAINPTQSFVYSNLLLTLHYHPAYTTADLKREHDAWASRHVTPLAGRRPACRNDANPDRKLRIGYVSPDFREHAVSRFILPVLKRHADSAFEVFAYADVSRPDEVTDAIRGEVDHWKNTNALSDEQLAAQINADQIDILIDLAAHSGKNRLLAFARKPAPVQTTWLAYCSTTGVDAIDFRLTDRFLDPPDTDLNQYTEKSVFLPDCYWCYPEPEASDIPDTVTTRPAGPPTFGCLNNFAKVTKPTLGLWMQLLLAVEDSRLILYAPPGRHRERVVDMMQQQGISEDRLEFVGRQSYADYLATWARIDVGLDPFPYGGGTTTCDALWMGVPVVTLRGPTAVSRAGMTLLSNIGLDNLVAARPREYVQLAANLVRERQELEKISASLRDRMRASPLMDPDKFTRNLEAAYRMMWQSWCATQR